MQQLLNHIVIIILLTIVSVTPALPRMLCKARVDCPVNFNGDTLYVTQVRGKGLWGPIWGFISFKTDMNTIFGAYFDHKGETPGLGAEIDTKKFQNQFKEKKIFDESGKFTSVKTIKGGAKPGDIHGVDAISGGTITSNGVTDMLRDCLLDYQNFFNKNRK